MLILLGQDGQMGMAKEVMMAQEEQGWSYSDKHVCSACVNDQHLSDAIGSESADDVSCDFCGSSPAASLDVLLGAFVDGVRLEYNDADSEGVPWDGREGGYQASTFDSWDLVGEFWDLFATDALAEKVRDSLQERTWIERDWVWRRRDAVLRDAWVEFSDAVKYRTRYVIWIVEDEESERQERFTGEVPVGKILHEVGDLLDELGLIREIEAGSILWRAQPHNTRRLMPTASAARLGTAPREFAKQPNRMSPAGIPMFYGAMDEPTAIAEVARHNVKGDRFATLGEFVLSSAVGVVDFTRLPAVPSLFHPEFGRYRREIAFLHEFVDTLSAPVTAGDEAIDYVPTQIMTEFFLRILKPASGRPITGIVYGSAVYPGGRSNVLDIPTERCVSAGETLGSDEPHLILRPDSIVRHRLSAPRGENGSSGGRKLRTVGAIVVASVLSLGVLIARRSGGRARR